MFGFGEKKEVKGFEALKRGEITAEEFEENVIKDRIKYTKGFPEASPEEYEYLCQNGLARYSLMTPEQDKEYRRRMNKGEIEWENYWHGEKEDLVGRHLMGALGSDDLDRTFNTFSPNTVEKWEKAASIADKIPDVLLNANYKGLYDECSAHYQNLQERFDYLLEENTRIQKELAELNKAYQEELKSKNK